MIIDSPILSGSVSVSGSLNISVPVSGSNVLTQNTFIALSYALSG